MSKGRLESAVMPEIRLALSRAGSTLHRNNQGLAWYGKDRDQPVKYGLGVGTGDLIGFTPVVITQDMVGETVAVYTSIEVKRPKGGREEPEQQNYVEVVQAAGGLAGFARSAEEAVQIIRRGIRRAIRNKP